MFLGRQPAWKSLVWFFEPPAVGGYVYPDFLQTPTDDCFRWPGGGGGDARLAVDFVQSRSVSGRVSEY
jgi:hypothetical protein